VYTLIPSEAQEGMSCLQFLLEGFQITKKRLKLTQDDAEEINWIKLAEIDKRIAFDHKKITSGYKLWQRFGGTFWSSSSKDRDIS
jgi:hypothetical protein